MSLLRKLTRPSVRKYTILLCSCYLLIVLVFHSRLQFHAPPVAEDADDIIARQVASSSNNNSHEKKAIPTLVPTLPDILFSGKPKEKQQFVVRRTAMPSPEMKKQEVLPDLFAGDQFEECGGAIAQNEFQFREVMKGVMAYSAYWDDRPNDFDNRFGGVKIRIMGLIMGKSYRPTLRCLFNIHGEERVSLVTYYEMCENHNRRWGGFIFSCEVPPEVQNRRMCAVRVGGTDTAPVLVPMYSVAPRPTHYTYAMCVPPLFGNVSSARLVEFLEMSLLLGAEHIMLYNFSVNDAVTNTLKHYINKGQMTVIPWELPGAIDKSMWYHGQIVAIQDCLYRHMGRTVYLAFNDIDEFMMPHTGTAWQEVIPRIDSERVCGFKFKSAFFNPLSESLPPLDDNLELIPSLMTHSNQRSSMFSSVRTKCMVKPRKIFEMGIHHISKPILASLGGVNVDPALAVLHHYRSCLAGFGMKCRDQVQDDTALQYGQKLYPKVRQVLDQSRLRHENAGSR